MGQNSHSLVVLETSITTLTRNCAKIFDTTIQITTVQYKSLQFQIPYEKSEFWEVEIIKCQIDGEVKFSKGGKLTFLYFVSSTFEHLYIEIFLLQAHLPDPKVDPGGHFRPHDNASKFKRTQF